LSGNESGEKEKSTSFMSGEIEDLERVIIILVTFPKKNYSGNFLKKKNKFGNGSYSLRSTYYLKSIIN